MLLAVAFLYRRKEKNDTAEIDLLLQKVKKVAYISS